MSPAIGQQPATNPLQRLALAFPAGLFAAVQVLSVAVGVVFAFMYAYDQDTLFPDRHLPRTWVLVSVASAVSVSALAVAFAFRGRPWVATFAAGLAGGTMLFAGANLANMATGVVVLVAGATALLAALALAVHQQQPRWGVVLGAGAAAALIFATVGFCVVFVSGSA